MSWLINRLLGKTSSDKTAPATEPKGTTKAKKPGVKGSEKTERVDKAADGVAIKAIGKKSEVSSRSHKFTAKNIKANFKAIFSSKKEKKEGIQNIKATIEKTLTPEERKILLRNIEVTFDALSERMKTQEELPEGLPEGLFRTGGTQDFNKSFREALDSGNKNKIDSLLRSQFVATTFDAFKDKSANLRSEIRQLAQLAIFCVNHVQNHPELLLDEESKEALKEKLKPLENILIKTVENEETTRMSWNAFQVSTVGGPVIELFKKCGLYEDLNKKMVAAEEAKAKAKEAEENEKKLSSADAIAKTEKTAPVTKTDEEKREYLLGVLTDLTGTMLRKMQDQEKAKKTNAKASFPKDLFRSPVKVANNKKIISYLDAYAPIKSNELLKMFDNGRIDTLTDPNKCSVEIEALGAYLKAFANTVMDEDKKDKRLLFNSPESKDKLCQALEPLKAIYTIILNNKDDIGYGEKEHLEAAIRGIVMLKNFANFPSTT